MAVKNDCIVMAASGNGIFKKAPMAVSAAKSAVRMMSLIFILSSIVN